MQNDQPMTQAPSSSDQSPQQAPPSVPGSTSAPEVQPEKPRKSHKKLVILLCVLIAVGIAVVAYLLFGTKKTAAPTETANSTTEQTTQDETSLLARLEVEGRDLAGYGIETYYEPTKRYLLLPALEDSSFAWAVTQRDTDNPVTKGQLLNYYRQELVSQGFEQYTEADEAISTLDKDLEVEKYKKDTVVCKLSSIPGSSDDEPASFISKVCSDLNTSQETADYMEQFYLAYEKSGNYADYLPISSSNPEPYLVTVRDNVAKSAIEGYEYLYGGIGSFNSGGAAVVFVRTTEGTNAGKWVFFAGRQAIQGCDEYTSELFQKALAHETCLDADTNEVTVKEYYSL